MLISIHDSLQTLIDDPADTPTALKWGLIGLLILTSFYLSYQWMIVDDLTELQRKQQKEVLLKQVFKSKHKQAHLLPFYRVQLQEVEKHFDEIIQALPKKTEVAHLILDISEIAVTNGLSIHMFEPKAEVVKKFYIEKPIYLKVTGHYQQLASFASDLAVLPRIVSLHDIELKPLKAILQESVKTSRSDSNNSNLLEMQAIIKTFRYVEQQKVIQK
jgi:type IV pilus assembly protein PilO